jgi:hypothetical protein
MYNHHIGKEETGVINMAKIFKGLIQIALKALPWVLIVILLSHVFILKSNNHVLRETLRLERLGVQLDNLARSAQA